MKKSLQVTLMLIAGLAFAGQAVAQVCCIYERSGSLLTRVATSFCTAPANGIICSQQAYNYSPSEGAPADPNNPPEPDDRLKGNGVGIFGGADCNACIEEINLPVELTSFDAAAVGPRDVLLTWETASELNNAGFHVERKVGSGLFEELGFVEGFGTTHQPKSYSYKVAGLDAGVHAFRLRQVDFDGAFEYSPVVEAAVEMPERFVLEAAYPNPFNPATTIRFGTAVETELSVELYDASGKLVRTLFEGVPEVGAMQSVSIDGSDLTSGTYIVKLSAENFQTSRPIVLLK